MKNEDEEKTQRGTGSLQRSKEGGDAENKKAELKKEIRGIREGHTTGGYCETVKLLEKEKELHNIIVKEIEDLEHSKEAGSGLKAATLKRELAGLAYRPRLVVAND